jgi:hypothetical protein
LAEGAQAFNIAEGSSPQAKDAVEQTRDGGTVMVMLENQRSPHAPREVPVENITRSVMTTFRLTNRPATALVPDATHPWTASFTLPELYFAEDGADRLIMRHGIDGPGRVLLRASDTDWSLFNNAPEKAKCAAVLLGEKLVKPSGAALVERGNVVCCSLDYRIATKFWRRLFTNMGIKLAAGRAETVPAFDEHGVLVNALAVRLGASSEDYLRQIESAIELPGAPAR